MRADGIRAKTWIAVDAGTRSAFVAPSSKMRDGRQWSEVWAHEAGREAATVRCSSCAPLVFRWCDVQISWVMYYGVVS